jgi:hypothetical protein
MDLDGGKFISWGFEGMGPEISTFLGPNGTRYTRCNFRAQKSLDFRATHSNAPRYGFGLLPHPNPYVLPHINNRYINSYNIENY